MSKFDAVIIGGGHNGLVCASYLSKKGYKTVVLEKNEKLGGLANYGSSLMACLPKCYKNYRFIYLN